MVLACKPSEHAIPPQVPGLRVGDMANEMEGFYEEIVKIFNEFAEEST